MIPEGATEIQLPEGHRCRSCKNSIRGYYETKNGQNVAYCAECGGGLGWNVPKHVTGQEQRHVRSRPEIKPSQRSRILERDGHACLECGRRAAPEVVLHVGHLISAKEGASIGMTENEIFDDENLYIVCEECNLGRSERSVDARFVLRFMRAKWSRAS